MSDKLRQAAQMALEAGEKSMSAMRGLYGGWRCGTAIAATEAAITALREALAEQPVEREHLTRDDVIRMAHEAGMSAHCGIVQDGKHVPSVAALKRSVPVEWLEHFASLVAAAERNACEKVCEAIEDEYQRTEGRRYPELKSDAETGARDCAAAIRARGAA